MRNKSVEEMKSENIIGFLDKGFSFNCSKNVWVKARDRSKRKVLLSGLGCMGVGTMWFNEEGREKYPHFKDAPEMLWEGGSM